MLALGFEFKDLYSLQGLKNIDQAFLEYLAGADSALTLRLRAARSEGISGKQESDLIIELSWHLEDFIAALFNIEHEQALVSDHLNELAVIARVKRLFVQRQAAREDISNYNSSVVEQYLNNAGIDLSSELSFAKKVANWMMLQDEESLSIARQYAAWATLTPQGQTRYKDGVLYKIPRKIDINNLLERRVLNHEGCLVGAHLRSREGFSLTDHDKLNCKAQDQANYCIHCHHQAKDSCSKGMKDKVGAFKVNELGIKLAGCPLEEKISEMNELKTLGSVIGALAVVVIDNPMCAGTGHRICNDCMKSCIYQKQEAVNIPLVESVALDDVLKLSYGFEIYSLLTRWNPLNFKQYLPKDDTNKKVMVVGLGPAGYTLAHYLLNEGNTVVAIDGLKIEPLDPLYSGIDISGKRVEFKPIKFIHQELFEDLNQRKAYGFGGVAEYGITVRWDKNYLTVLRLLLERRANFRMYGGIRLNSNITYPQIAALGFDHLALCMGAGKPNLLSITNGLAKGVRTASDFLMALQLTGAARANSIANLEVQLPICVIGGGLTAIDTATESLAYYPVMVEKLLCDFEKLSSPSDFLNSLSPTEREVFEVYLRHAKKLREVSPNEKLQLIKSWGGVKVLYRRSLAQSPAYRLNHEEVEKALEEGIEFVEDITPISIELDEGGHIKGILTESGVIPCKTMLLAAGTQPNTVAADEDPKHFKLNGKYFRSVDSANTVINNELCPKPQYPSVIMDRGEQGPSISYFGDLHPSYAGNVVKAMASAKGGYPEVVALLESKRVSRLCGSAEFFAIMDAQLLARVEKVLRLTPNIVEVQVRAPLAARNFRGGQFYRLQNYEVNAPHKNGKLLAMEGLALTGAAVDLSEGILSTIVLEMGGSSDICAELKNGEPVVLMGPTGEPTVIPKDETVVLIGGGLGNAVLFSIGKAMRENGCRVLYFAGYKKAQDRYKIEEIQAAADQVVWCCDEAELPAFRPQDRSFKGNIIEAIKACGLMDGNQIMTKDADRVIVIGSDRMMAAVAHARHNSLRNYFKAGHVAIGSINSPMQCMMKEICGQCIARHVDPSTGEESYVYSCKNQDQFIDCVDFEHLNARLSQNHVSEQLYRTLKRQY